MERVIDAEAPASIPLKTQSGIVFDANNISGAKKQQLIADGELSIEEFTTPPNMPGAKLAALRAKAKADFEGSQTVSEEEKKEENPYKVGDVIEHKNNVTAVVEVDGNKIKYKKANGELSKSVHWKNVLPVNSDKETGE